MKHQHAFTLVELAIVLVIIGLIVGGVLVGRDLIRAAELQSVVTQEQKYVTATNTFRLKYKRLPGDLTNGTTYWGIAGGTGDDAACVAATSTIATCNGDGNGRIEYNGSTRNEGPRFWQQLAAAGLIEGNYNGVAGATFYTVSPLNSPAGRISNSLWYVYNFAAQTTGSNRLFDGWYDNSISLGGSNAAINNWSFKEIFTAGEMSSLDSKIDDGMPATGKFVAIAQFINTCTDATDNTTLTAKYRSTNTALACAALFRQVF